LLAFCLPIGACANGAAVSVLGLPWQRLGDGGVITVL